MVQYMSFITQFLDQTNAISITFVIIVNINLPSWIFDFVEGTCRISVTGGMTGY